MYKINEISKIAGISTRTLRYYDDIELLKPSIVADNNYRMYSETEIDLLQQILFYKELGFPLDEIKKIINDDEFDYLQALEFHKVKLLSKREKIDRLIQTIDLTIKKERGETTMSNNEKFNAFKENLIQENEEKYGVELRDKYGDVVIENSNQRIKRMSKWQFNEANRIAEEIKLLLLTAFSTGNPQSKEAQEVCALHQKWIQFYWESYNEDHHLALVEMYTQDERFKKYYEAVIAGATEFLYQAMKYYLKKTT